MQGKTIDQQTVAARFELAADFCRDFTQSMVIEELPHDLKFNFPIVDRLPLDEQGWVKFIGGRLLKPEEIKGVEKAKAAQFLWVNGKIPVWINLLIDYFGENYACVEIFFNPDSLCERDDLLMHQQEGNPPFHVLGPPSGKMGQKIHFRSDK